MQLMVALGRASGVITAGQSVWVMLSVLLPTSKSGMGTSVHGADCRTLVKIIMNIELGHQQKLEEIRVQADIS